MEKNQLQELKEVVQSSNINFLFGAGCSLPFLPLLGNIEKDLNTAGEDEALREVQLKKYLFEVMLPNKKVLNNTVSDANYKRTIENYENFFQRLADVILQRKSTILSKQVNLFTTNIDVLMEKTLESLLIEYNDGFSGKFTPIFSPANYKRSISQRSLHYDHTSEIPVINIIKIHGSLTWKNDTTGEKIIFSHTLDHFKDGLSSETGAKFAEKYKQILVVNPEESKHLESVLNVYYSELLRMYSTELEKENATLFIIGFSMEDRHIREITLRAAKSNPTLRIYVCCSKGSEEKMNGKLETAQHPNICFLVPEDATAKYTLGYFTENILKEIVHKESSDA